jgi:hypothetical protein
MIKNLTYILIKENHMDCSLLCRIVTIWSSLKIDHTNLQFKINLSSRNLSNLGLLQVHSYTQNKNMNVNLEKETKLLLNTTNMYSNLN